MTPVGRGLGQAYGAIVGTAAANPAAAQRAQYGYAQALQQARIGNRAGSLAASASAQAEAIEGAPAAPIVRAYAPAQSAIAPLGARVQPAVPIVENGPALSGDLVVARNELELAGQLSHANLDGAKKTYRRALDDYLSGNAERSQTEARAAFAAAADALARVK